MPVKPMVLGAARWLRAVVEGSRGLDWQRMPVKPIVRGEARGEKRSRLPCRGESVADTFEHTQGQFYWSFDEATVQSISAYRSYDPEIAEPRGEDDEAGEGSETSDGEDSDESRSGDAHDVLSNRDCFIRTMCELSVPDDVYCKFHQTLIFQTHLIQKDKKYRVKKEDLDFAKPIRDEAQRSILRDIMYYTCDVSRMREFAEAVFKDDDVSVTTVEHYRICDKTKLKYLTDGIYAMLEAYKGLVAVERDKILEKHANEHVEGGWKASTRNNCLDLAFEVQGLNFSACVRETCRIHRRKLDERAAPVELPVCLCIPRHDTPTLAGNVCVCTCLSKHIRDYESVGERLVE